MNLIVFIDKEQNILDLNILKDYKECQTYLNNLVQNNSLIFDRDPSTYTIDELMDNPTLTPRFYSGNMIRQ